MHPGGCTGSAGGSAERRSLGAAEQSEEMPGREAAWTLPGRRETEDCEEKEIREDARDGENRGDAREAWRLRGRGDTPGECEEGGDSEAELRDPARGSVSAGETGGPRGKGEGEGGELEDGESRAR